MFCKDIINDKNNAIDWQNEYFVTESKKQMLFTATLIEFLLC